MALDVDPPPVPTIAEAGSADEYRREAIQTHLEAGAWAEAFDRWREETTIDRETFQIAVDLGLVEEFDFFWDDFAERVGYNAPGIPEDWRSASYHHDLESWGQVSAINAGLAELGQVVCEVLVTDYLDVDDADES